MSSKAGEARISAGEERPAADSMLMIKDVSGLNQGGEILNKIFDNTHIQIAYLDTAFNFVRINRAYAEACGHAPEFFDGKNHFELYPNPENEASEGA